MAKFEGQERRMPRIEACLKEYGMNTLDSHLIQLYNQGKISYGDLITKCRDAEGVVQKIHDQLKADRNSMPSAKR